MTRKQWIKIMAGPLSFAATILLLQNSFGFKAAAAAATAVWMALWWILRPVVRFPRRAASKVIRQWLGIKRK